MPSRSAAGGDWSDLNGADALSTGHPIRPMEVFQNPDREIAAIPFAGLSRRMLNFR
jgi:hypothetical protein